jgi:Fe2+ transport system protein FeoA
VAVETPAPAARRAPEGIVYLLRRVAAATEDRLQGFPEGSEVKVIEERPKKLLVEIQGMQFEINREDATSDLDRRDHVLASGEEERTARLASRTAGTEDRKFLDEENARRRGFAEARIEGLRSTILSIREQIATLETEDKTSSLADHSARKEQIAALQTQIANCDREIQILSDAVARGE